MFLKCCYNVKTCDTRQFCLTIIIKLVKVSTLSMARKRTRRLQIFIGGSCHW